MKILQCQNVWLVYLISLNTFRIFLETFIVYRWESFFILILNITNSLIIKNGKTLNEKWRDLWRKGTHKHMETYLRYFDDHRCLSQSEESKCMWTHGKDGATWEFWKASPGGCETGRGGEEGMVGKLNGNYLKLIPGMCLEDNSFCPLNTALVLNLR